MELEPAHLCQDNDLEEKAFDVCTWKMNLPRDVHDCDLEETNVMGIELSKQNLPRNCQECDLEERAFDIR